MKNRIWNIKDAKPSAQTGWIPLVLLLLSFYSLWVTKNLIGTLIDMRPKSGAVYIHSASEAYNEEQVLSTKRLHNWLEKFQMEHHQIHCSGHAKSEDLMDMVKEIDSKCYFRFIQNIPLNM